MQAGRARLRLVLLALLQQAHRARLDARLDIDTAVILLDGGKKYKNKEIEQIGVVTGARGRDQR